MMCLASHSAALKIHPFAVLYIASVFAALVATSPLFASGCVLTLAAFCLFKLPPFTAKDMVLIMFTSVSETLALIAGHVRVIRGKERLESARRQAVLDASIDGVVTVDHDGYILNVNASFERLFGLLREEIVGESFIARLIPRDLQARHYEIFEELRAARRPIKARVRGEVAHPTHPDSALGVFPVEVSLSSAALDGDDFIVTAVIRDISEEVKTRAALTTALAQARDAVRARDDILTSASHDIRTPLTVIQGNLGIIETRLARLPDPTFLFTDARAPVVFDRPFVEKHLNQIKKGLLRLNSTVDEISDAARLSIRDDLALSFDEAALGAVIREALTQLSYRAISSDVHVDCDESVRAWGDARRLERVLINIIGNAIKYSPPGAAIFVSGWQENGHAWLRVEDHGIGIPADDIPHIFERYHRASNTRDIQGTGIGLAGARRIVDLHHGRISVRSEEGVGTTITIELPARMEDALEDARQEAADA